MRKNLKKNEAITLISLVVTIIVLIILAGVSINLILGENGIVKKAQAAKQNMELAVEEEARSLNELYAQMSGESNVVHSYDATAKLVEFKREIASAISDMGIETAANADASTMSSNIRSLSGSSSADKVSYNNTNSGLTSTNVQGAVDELNNSLTSLGILEETIDIPNNPTYSEIYTATKKCKAIITISGNDYSGTITVNGIEYCRINSGKSDIVMTTVFPPIQLNIGDVIVGRSVGANGNIKIYV